MPFSCFLLNKKHGDTPGAAGTHGQSLRTVKQYLDSVLMHLETYNTEKLDIIDILNAVFFPGLLEGELPP